MMENSIKMDDLGVPLFLETSIYICNCYRIITLYQYGGIFNMVFLISLLDALDITDWDMSHMI